MKKPSHTDQGQNDILKKKSRIVNDFNRKDFAGSDRIEWLKELYAEWQEKRNAILNYDNEPYIINEPDELDTEISW